MESKIQITPRENTQEQRDALISELENRLANAMDRALRTGQIREGQDGLNDVFGGVEVTNDPSEPSLRQLTSAMEADLRDTPDRG